MLTVVRCRIFCLPDFYPKIPKDEDIKNCNFACGCETWLLTLREDCRLRVFENRVLRRLFASKRDEVTGVEKTT
jgi:hypothetical protein